MGDNRQGNPRGSRNGPSLTPRSLQSVPEPLPWEPDESSSVVPQAPLAEDVTYHISITHSAVGGWNYRVSVGDTKRRRGGLYLPVSTGRKTTREAAIDAVTDVIRQRGMEGR